jgi:hypothetical protein
MSRRVFALALLAAASMGAVSVAQAGVVRLTVQVENLAPADGIAFAPLHFGVHQGVFDAFDRGGTAGAAIVSVAEGGAGGAWQSAFALSEPQAVRGTVGGLLLSGASASLSVLVDPLLNPFFTFAAMVVPSNDFFIGNDSPLRYRIFDAAGALALDTIDQTASDIWDAGSELFDPAAAAFVGDNGLRRDQNGVVEFNFAELSGFDGLTTGAGYVFRSGLSADTAIYRIRLSAMAVPEPATWALVLGGLLVAGAAGRPRAGVGRRGAPG